MKKAGIITIHNAYNYGAVLQSLALMKKIQALGVDCEFIDFDPPATQRVRKIFIKDYSFSGILRNIRALFAYKTLKKRKKAFDAFIDKYYNLSILRYETLEDFEKSNLDYDYCITGSDQTFCLHLRNKVEDMKPYFLPYVQGKKISYASSFGEKIKLNTEQEELWIAERLKEYNSLSVREYKSAEYVKRLTGGEPQVVLDPTLLLCANEWADFEKPINIKGEYILFYSVLSNKKIVKAVRALAKKTGLKILAPHLKNHYELFDNFIRMDHIGPGGFLSLIKNAKYVVTTSFHGTVFAINYQKPFSSMLLGEGNRISSILSTLCLENRLAKNTEDLIVQYQTEIDYNVPQALLKKERQQSLNFLEKALDAQKD